MTLNARMSQGDPRLYTPNRDVAHNFDQVIMEVAKRCEEGTWDALVSLAREKKVSDEELGLACQAICKFVARQPVKGESMAACLASSGFLELSPAARVIVSAYIGTVILGMHWAGVREATLGGAGPAMTYQKLRWHGMVCAKLMTMRPWKRRLYSLWKRVRLAYRAFTQGDKYGA